MIAQNDYANMLSAHIDPTGCDYEERNKDGTHDQYTDRAAEVCASTIHYQGLRSSNHGDEIQYTEDVFHHILFGGQHTLERIRGAKSTRANLNRQMDKVMGFIPVVEDWHAQVMLLTVRICSYMHHIAKITKQQEFQ